MNSQQTFDICKQLLEVKILCSDFKLAELQELKKIIPSLNFEANQKQKLIQRIDGEIRNQRIDERLDRISANIEALTANVNNEKKKTAHMEKHMPKKAPTWLKIFRWITLFIIAAGIILGGVALLVSQDQQFIHICGYIIIATAIVQICLEIFNTLCENNYEPLPIQEEIMRGVIQQQTL